MRTLFRMTVAGLLACTAAQAFAAPADLADLQRLALEVRALQAEVATLRRTLGEQRLGQQEQIEAAVARAQARWGDYAEKRLGELQGQALVTLRSQTEQLAADSVRRVGAPIIQAQVDAAVQQQITALQPQFERSLSTAADKVAGRAVDLAAVDKARELRGMAEREVVFATKRHEQQLEQLRDQTDARLKAMMVTQKEGLEALVASRTAGQSTTELATRVSAIDAHVGKLEQRLGAPGTSPVAKPSPSARATASANERFTIFMSFREESEAIAAVSRLKTIKRIGEPELVPVDGVYTVYVGPYASRQLARDDAGRIRSVMNIPVRVRDQDGKVL